MATSRRSWRRPPSYASSRSTRAVEGDTVESAHVDLVAIGYHGSPDVTNATVDALFGAVWPGHAARDLCAVLRHRSGCVSAYADDEVVGFVIVAWDGRLHAVLLDTTLHPRLRRRGIGSQLMNQVQLLAQQRGRAALHVDFGPELRDFSVDCGFGVTGAERLRLASESVTQAGVETTATVERPDKGCSNAARDLRLSAGIVATAVAEEGMPETMLAMSEVPSETMHSLALELEG